MELSHYLPPPTANISYFYFILSLDGGNKGEVVLLQIYNSLVPRCCTIIVILGRGGVLATDLPPVPGLLVEAEPGELCGGGGGGGAQQGEGVHLQGEVRLQLRGGEALAADRAPVQPSRQPGPCRGM